MGILEFSLPIHQNTRFRKKRNLKERQKRRTKTQSDRRLELLTLSSLFSDTEKVIKTILNTRSIRIEKIGSRTEKGKSLPLLTFCFA